LTRRFFGARDFIAEALFIAVRYPIYKSVRQRRPPILWGKENRKQYGHARSRPKPSPDRRGASRR